MTLPYMSEFDFEKAVAAERRADRYAARCRQKALVFKFFERLVRELLD
jgi:hypothetical protein